MNPAASASSTPPVVYPESDGKPLADDTEHLDHITYWYSNLRAALPQHFVAADLLWYPVEGNPRICTAPDVYVALGRPPGRRGSYRPWDEAGIKPQVVIEFWSPKQTFNEQVMKLRFFERYGAEEFYLYDIDRRQLSVWLRRNDALEPVNAEDGWVSELLGVRFIPTPDGLQGAYADGRPFLVLADAIKERDAAQAERDAERAERDAAQAERDAERGARIALEAEVARLRALLPPQ